MFLLDVVFYSFIVVAFIQVIYYGLLFGSFSFKNEEKKHGNAIPVSVLICAKNEAVTRNLKTLTLPSSSISLSYICKK